MKYALICDVIEPCRERNLSITEPLAKILLGQQVEIKKTRRFRRLITIILSVGQEILRRTVPYSTWVREWRCWWSTLRVLNVTSRRFFLVTPPAACTYNLERLETNLWRRNVMPCYNFSLCPFIMQPNLHVIGLQQGYVKWVLPWIELPCSCEVRYCTTHCVLIVRGTKMWILMSVKSHILVPSSWEHLSGTPNGTRIHHWASEI
jgi:hypothetical protein